MYSWESSNIGKLKKLQFFFVQGRPAKGRTWTTKKPHWPYGRRLATAALNYSKIKYLKQCDSIWCTSRLMTNSRLPVNKQDEIIAIKRTINHISTQVYIHTNHCGDEASAVQIKVLYFLILLHQNWELSVHLIDN